MTVQGLSVPFLAWSSPALSALWPFDRPKLEQDLTGEVSPTHSIISRAAQR
jgi:hypothetical protein